MFKGKPKATPIIDWAQTAIAEIRRLEREIEKLESRIGELEREIEAWKNGRML